MSDLGRLSRLSALGPSPLENFTTEALAIAIGHDDRPIKQTLQAVDRSCHVEDCQQMLATFDVAAADMVTVTAQTQMVLWPSATLCQSAISTSFCVCSTHTNVNRRSGSKSKSMRGKANQTAFAWGAKLNLTCPNQSGYEP